MGATIHTFMEAHNCIEVATGLATWQVQEKCINLNLFMHLG